MIIGIISGYFNPLHYGHIEYIGGAKKQCNLLIAIINNDFQVGLKGSKPFMDEKHRGKIVSSIKEIDDTIISIDQDRTVCQSIRLLHKVYSYYEMRFFNSGDRGNNNVESAEVKLCEELGIHYVFLDLPKIFSSSEILKH